VVGPWEGRGRRTADVAPTLYFGDVFANVYAVNAETGALRWKVKVDDHPAAILTGSPVLHADRLFVPLSAMGNMDLGNPNSTCCTNRGAVLSLDARTGRLRWKTYTIASPAIEQYRNAAGTPQFGPAGASVMDTPTLDPKRGRLYFGTGKIMVHPQTITATPFLRSAWRTAT